MVIVYADHILHDEPATGKGDAVGRIAVAAARNGDGVRGCYKLVVAGGKAAVVGGHAVGINCARYAKGQ